MFSSLKNLPSTHQEFIIKVKDVTNLSLTERRSRKGKLYDKTEDI